MVCKEILGLQPSRQQQQQRRRLLQLDKQITGEDNNTTFLYHLETSHSVKRALGIDFRRESDWNKEYIDYLLGVNHMLDLYLTNASRIKQQTYK